MRALTRSSSTLPAISGTDLRHHRLAGAPAGGDRRLENGARLHLGDLRIGDRQAAAAEAEHRVELVQLAGAIGELLRIRLHRLGNLGDLFLGVRQNSAGGSSSRMVTGNPCMISNSSTKSRALHGQQLVERSAACGSSSDRIISRTTRMRSPRRTCARCGEPCPRRRISAPRGHRSAAALARTPSCALRRPAHSVPNSPDSAGSIIGTRPASTCPAVDSDDVALPGCVATLVVPAA